MDHRYYEAAQVEVRNCSCNLEVWWCNDVHLHGDIYQFCEDQNARVVDRSYHNIHSRNLHHSCHILGGMEDLEARSILCNAPWNKMVWPSDDDTVLVLELDSDIRHDGHDHGDETGRCHNLNEGEA